MRLCPAAGTRCHGLLLLLRLLSLGLGVQCSLSLASFCLCLVLVLRSFPSREVNIYSQPHLRLVFLLLVPPSVRRVPSLTLHPSSFFCLYLFLAAGSRRCIIRASTSIRSTSRSIVWPSPEHSTHRFSRNNLEREF
ncbi:hypothetical protein LZ30DRAFT_701473 [Colletotrichum cereale]|nr:hypothetical protein LZ30DRAFT_701473 [Colletotrichum cereale]